MEDHPIVRQQYIQGHALREGIPRQEGIPRTAPLVRATQTTSYRV